MSTRINTPFVLTLFATLGALALGVTGLYYMLAHRDAAALIQRGDAMMHAGEPRRALDFYGPALRIDHTDAALIDRYLDALARAPVDDVLTAYAHLEQLRQWKRRAAALRPDDPQPRMRFYAFEHRIARELADRSVYDQLHALTRIRLDAEPDDPVALKYHGIALVHRLTSDTPPEQRRVARDMLERAHTHFTDDYELLHHLARWHLFEARQRERDGQPQSAAAHRERALEHARAILEVEPDDIERRIRHLHVLTRLPDDEAHAQARATLDVLAHQLADQPEPPRAVLTTAELLLRLARHEHEEDAKALHDAALQARELIDRAVRVHREHVPLLAALARMRALTGDRDRAIEAYEAMRRHSHRASPLTYLRNRTVRIAGTMQLADLVLARAEAQADEVKRTGDLQRAAALIDELAQTADAQGKPELTMLRGKLALLRGQTIEATTHLDRALEELDAPPPNLLALSSQAHRRLGNWGTAANRLERLLEQHPERSDIRTQLAELLLDGGRLGDAQRHIRTLLRQHPDRVQPRRLLVRALAQRGQIDLAMAHFDRLDDASRRELLPAIVHAHLATSQRDAAGALLERHVAAHPADIGAIHLLVGLEPEAVRDTELLAHAREHGADPLAVRLVAQHRADADHLWLRKLVAEQPPGRGRALMKAELALQAGDIDGLRRASEEAAAFDPEHPDVVALRFELALHDADWPTAQRLAEKAERANLDQARGAFFAARLAAARDQLAQATAYYRRALGQRPVHAEGWRRFGDVLMRRDDLTAALDAYRRAIEQQPDNVAALRGLAAALVRANEHDAALEHLRQAVRYAPQDERLVEQYVHFEQRFGEPERARRVREQLAHTHPHHASNRRALAMHALAHGDRAIAAEHFQHLVSHRFAHSAAHGDAPPLDLLALVSLRLEMNEPKAALALLEDHATSSRAHAPLLARKARARAMLGRGDEAGESFERALAASEGPEHVVDAARQWVAAEGVADALVRLDEKSETAPPFWRQLAAAQLELELGRTDRVIERLEPWQGRTDETAETARWMFHRLRAQAHQRAGEPAAAAAAYTKMLALRPDHLVTLNDLAYLLTDRLGDAEAALPLAERAAALAPQNARVLDTLGWTQYHLGKLDAARQTLEQAVRIESVPEAHLHLGIVYTRLDRHDAAQEQFQRARELATQVDNRPVLSEASQQLEQAAR